MSRSIGLLGGTFDPPHIGHLVVADQVLDQLGLDEVKLLVAKDPWQKTNEATITSAQMRLAMCEAAVGGVDRISVCDIEHSLDGPTYTTRTLDALASQEPDTSWLMIMGSDTAAGLDTWHDPGRLSQQCTIVVVNRSGSDTEVPSQFKVERMQIPGIEVSSSMIRRRVGEGRSTRFLVPEGVINLFEGWNLYSQG